MNEAKNKEREALYLGALLHDVGKFWQRSEPVKGKHQVLSMKYVEEKLGNEKIALYTRWHHQNELDKAIREDKIKDKDAVFAQIVCLADSLSSMERTWFQKIKDEEGNNRLTLEQKNSMVIKSTGKYFQ